VETGPARPGPDPNRSAPAAASATPEGPPRMTPAENSDPARPDPSPTTANEPPAGLQPQPVASFGPPSPTRARQPKPREPTKTAKRAAASGPGALVPDASALSDARKSPDKKKLHQLKLTNRASRFLFPDDKYE
jgi:hypothetical protein